MLATLSATERWVEAPRQYPTATGYIT